MKLRKGLICAAMATAVLVGVVGCGKSEEVEVATIETTAIEETTTAQVFSQEILEKLFEDNLTFCQKVYYMDNLTTTGEFYENNPNTNLMKCDTDLFANYNEYVTFVSNTYVSKRAAQIVESGKYHAPEGEDKEIYYYRYFTHPAGEIVNTIDADWDSGYELTITTETERKILFKARTTKLINGVIRDYEVDGVLVIEDGVWKLEGEVY